MLLVTSERNGLHNLSAAITYIIETIAMQHTFRNHSSKNRHYSNHSNTQRTVVVQNGHVGFAGCKGDTWQGRGELYREHHVRTHGSIIIDEHSDVLDQRGRRELETSSTDG